MSYNLNSLTPIEVVMRDIRSLDNGSYARTLNCGLLLGLRA